MPQDHDQLTPTPFEPAHPSGEPAAAPPAADSERPRWVIPALLALLVLTALVLFGLPRLTDQQESAAGDDPTTSPTTAASPGAATGSDRSKSNTKPGPDGSPWSDAQQAALRKEAQDILAQLLEQQEALQALNVESWAGEDFSAAATAAAEGDASYRERDYSSAKSLYSQSLQQLQAIHDSIPERVSAQLTLAKQALEDGDAVALDGALQRAATMDPQNAELAALRQRATAMPKVVAAMEQARQAEADGNLEQALAALQEATRLDPAHQRAVAERTRVANQLTENRFNRAMSEGYAALDAGRYSAARSAFNQAKKLRSDSGEAASALGEVQVAETAYRLRNYEQKGTEQEAAEDWQQAINTYESALKLDPSVVFAQEGLARARPQASINQSLDSVLNRPERLSDMSVARAAGGLLQQARSVQPAGPGLQNKISRLEQLLAAASQPVTVTLRSDQQTQVTVYKVAQLGQFSEQQVSLRPGTYTAVGIRKGYRDVRQTFTVSPDQPTEAIVIICTEAI